MKKDLKPTLRFKGSIDNEELNVSESNHLGHALSLGSEEQIIALDNALPENFYTLSRHFQGECGGFLGYSFLEQIAQNALISAGVETLADEMTRRFIELLHTSKGVENSENEVSIDERILKMNEDLREFDVQDLFRRAAEKIGYYGGCLVFIDNGTPERLLKTPLILDKTTFTENSLKSLILIDPLNCTPGSYNSINPLRKDYFQPSTWWIAGKEVHASRFLYFCGKEAPLLYKPAYNFFGVPVAQLAWEYVLHFTRSREAAARLLTKFSLTALKTNMSGALAGEGTNFLDARLNYFVEKQNNNGIFALDKEQEDLVKLDTSLSGTTDIVRQSLELLSTIFRIPAVKLLGISPSGFNATGQSDIHNFYDFCSSMQEKQLSQNMQKLLDIFQINRFGNIDKTLVFRWLPLGDEEKQRNAEIEKIKAQTLGEYYDREIITREEARSYLVHDKENIFVLL